MWDGLICTVTINGKICGNVAFRRFEDRLACAICEFCFRDYVKRVGVDTARERCPIIQIKPRVRPTVAPRRTTWYQWLMKDDD